MSVGPQDNFFQKVHSHLDVSSRIVERIMFQKFKRMNHRLMRMVMNRFFSVEKETYSWYERIYCSER